MKPKLLLGWILVGMGVLFLACGLVVTIFATVTVDSSLLQSTPSMWVVLANTIMDFTLQLLAMEWTATRVGIFLIVVGMVLEGVGAYSLMSVNV